LSRILAAMVALSALLCGTVAAQRSDLPGFEVASVRLSPPPGPFSMRMSDTRVDIVAYSLRSVLSLALRAKDYELVAPGWLNDAYVEIHATNPPGATVKEVPEMLRRLFIERFGLALHVEARPIDAYHLIVGTSGLKMEKVDPVDEIDKKFEPLFTTSGQPMTDAVRQTPEGPVRTMSLPRGMRQVTGRTMYERTSTDRGTYVINAVRMTMTEFVSLLENNLDSPVVDRTELRGIYKFSIELPRDATTLREFASLGMAPGASSPTSVSTTKAVETLGLKLERRRTPMDVKVVDQINRTPSPN